MNRAVPLLSSSWHLCLVVRVMRTTCSTSSFSLLLEQWAWRVLAPLWPMGTGQVEVVPSQPGFPLSSLEQMQDLALMAKVFFPHLQDS